MRHRLSVHGGVTLVCAFTVCVLFVTVGCEQEQSLPESPQATKPASPAIPPSQKILPDHSPVSSGRATAGKESVPSDGVLRLTGVEMKIPEGWIQESIQTRPMAPVAIFRLPAKSQAQKDGTVRITYFPGMKGMDDRNIDRWVGQITKADGKPATRDDAKTEIVNLDHVRITIVDVSGVMRMSSGMPGEGATVTNSRLIAAIVDHPVGPHFVKASGDATTIEAWTPSIKAFLNSTLVK